MKVSAEISYNITHGIFLAEDYGLVNLSFPKVSGIPPLHLRFEGAEVLPSRCAMQDAFVVHDCIIIHFTSNAGISQDVGELSILLGAF